MVKFLRKNRSSKKTQNQEPASLEPAPITVTTDMKPIDVIDACINFINQNDGKLNFDASSCFECNYNNRTLYAMSQQEQSEHNYKNYSSFGTYIVGYYFKLEFSDFGFDKVYELRFLDDKKFEFSKKDTNPEVYKKVENLFNLLDKNYCKAVERRKIERAKADQERLNNAVVLEKPIKKPVTSRVKNTLTTIPFEVKVYAGCGVVALIGMFVWISLTNYIYKNREPNAKEKFETKVAEYKKSLSGYLEQTENVAHYRDSLINHKVY